MLQTLHACQIQCAVPGLAKPVLRVHCQGGQFVLLGTAPEGRVQSEFEQLADQVNRGTALKPQVFRIQRLHTMPDYSRSFVLGTGVCPVQLKENKRIRILPMYRCLFRTCTTNAR